MATGKYSRSQSGPQPKSRENQAGLQLKGYARLIYYNKTVLTSQSSLYCPRFTVLALLSRSQLYNPSLKVPKLQRPSFKKLRCNLITPAQPKITKSSHYLRTSHVAITGEPVRSPRLRDRIGSRRPCHMGTRTHIADPAPSPRKNMPGAPSQDQRTNSYRYSKRCIYAEDCEMCHTHDRTSPGIHCH